MQENFSNRSFHFFQIQTVLRVLRVFMIFGGRSNHSRQSPDTSSSFPHPNTFRNSNSSLRIFWKLIYFSLHRLYIITEHLLLKTTSHKEIARSRSALPWISFFQNSHGLFTSDAILFSMEASFNHQRLYLSEKQAKNNFNEKSDKNENIQLVKCLVENAELFN